MGFSRIERILLGAIVSLFVLAASVLSWDNVRTKDLAPRFHWPDETTNWFFAERVTHGESLVIPEDRNVTLGNRVHPRSANVRPDGAMVPGGYLGMPLWYGLIGRVLGDRAMLFVTPLLAAVGLLALASLLRRVLDGRHALLATALLALHPAVLLFSVTAFLPNVPFVALLLVGLWVGFHGDATSPTVTRMGMSGLVIGLALTMRTHELLWVVALVGACAGMRRLRLRSWIALAVGMALPFVPVLVLQAQLYGSSLTTGYALLASSGAAPTEFAGGELPIPSALRALVAPFGWHPGAAFVRFWQYLVVPYPWFMALVVMGFVVAIVRRQHLALVVGTVMLWCWLVLFYGSWTIADPLVRATNVLTISYVRYWIPLVVAMAPLAAIGLHALVTMAPVRWRSVIAVCCCLGIVRAALPVALRDSAEGLLRQRAALAEYRTRARAVIAATADHPETIIVSHRLDKAFFPERAVIHAPDDWGTWGAEWYPAFRDALATEVARGGRVAWYTTHDAGSDHPPGVLLAPIGTSPYGDRLFAVRGVVTP